MAHLSISKPSLKKILFLFIIFLLAFNLVNLSLLRRSAPPQSPPSFAPEINSSTPSPAKASPVPASFTLLVGGDVMLARSVNKKMHNLNNFQYPFEKIAPFLKEADLTLVNLESPFGENCPSTDEGMVFCADDRSIAGLLLAGVDLVSVANNHFGDQGETGALFTLNALQENFLKPIGLRAPVCQDLNGFSVCFLAYNTVYPQNPSLGWGDPDLVVSEVKRFKSQADLLILYFHWGKEYESAPLAGSGCPFSPRQVAHQAIDAGADLVLGSHPHVVGETEIYKDKLIIYSLGNLVFDQTWSEATQKGALVKLVFEEAALSSWELIPINIVDYQPQL